MSFGKSRFLCLFGILAILGCSHKRKVYNEDCYVQRNRQNLQRKVLDALKDRNSEMMTKLSSCKFLVGPPSSEGAFVEPQSIFPYLLQATSKYGWEEKGEDLGGQFNLFMAGSENRGALIFKRDPNGDWYWAGFVTTDPEATKNIVIVK